MNVAEPDDAEPSTSDSLDEVGGPPEPYRHDTALVPVLAQLADAACSGAGDPHEASWRAEQLAKQVNPPVERPAVLVLVNAFLCVLRYEEVPQAGVMLTPLDGPSLLPEALRDASNDVREAWLALAGEVTHPVARARLLDIVFSLRLMSNGRHAAEQAARAYLDGAGGSQRAEAQANGVVRAWTLARSVGNPTLEQESAELMLGIASDMLGRDEHPYAIIPMLCALIAPPRGKKADVIDSRVDDVLDRALSAYAETHVLKDLVAIVRKRAAGDLARVEAADRRLVEAMLDRARAATEPMVIRQLFNEVASVARQHGLEDLERVAVASLQSAPALDWETTAYSVNFPSSAFDTYLPGFDKATDWREALNIWLLTDSPTGHYETNLATTRQTQQASVLRYLFTTVMYRDGDMPARTLSGEDEIFARDLAHTELHYLGMCGIFLANALHWIAERFGIPPRDDLETFLRSSGGDPTLMRVLATALQLFWVAEYDAAVHLAVPKVEAAARALLLEINEPVYRAAVGDATGQFPGLGSLLPLLLANDIDPDWERFLRTFLLGEGSNVRNLVAHGFAYDIDPLNTAVSLRALAVLALITSQSALQRDTATVKAALAKPARPRPRRNWWQRIAAAISAARVELRRG